MKQYNSIAQRARVREAFGTPRTMLEAARLTKVERANICWYVHDSREEGTIFTMGKRICKVSNARAQTYTTNPNAWQSLVARTRPLWEPLQDSQKIQLWEAIRAYFLAHYDGESVNPAPEVAALWEESVKPFIEREGVL